MILVDYPQQARLKIWGNAQILEAHEADGVIEQARSRTYAAVIERVFVIRVEAFDWNCPQHITPRYTEEQIQEALKPTVARIEVLEPENNEMRKLTRHQ